MRIMLDAGKCAGFASCTILAPELFELDEDEGTAVLRRADCPADLVAGARAAMRDCPTRAIALEDDA